MSNIVFKNREMYTWATEVMNYVTEGPGSLYGASEKLYDVLNRLGSGTIWNGASAITNYERIKKSMLAIYDYFTNFGKTFTTMATELAGVFSSLEGANGASGVSFENIGGKYNDPNLTPANISPNDDYSSYNVEKMEEMASDIDACVKFIQGDHARLLEKFTEIDKGDDPATAILAGANGEEKTLHKALESNVEESLTQVENDLTAVSADIRQALENAKAAGSRIGS